MKSPVKLFKLVFFLALILVNCSCSKQYGMSSEDLAEVIARPVPGQATTDFNDEFSSERKVIFNANLKLIVSNPDSTNQKIEALTKKYEGYINQIGSDQTIIRVKSEHLENAIQDISNLGKVQNKNIYGKDVTNTYLDLGIRLENAEKARNRYLELLDKAVSVEEILSVEKELERLNEVIDLIKGQMNRINHLDAFSTITINLQEKKKLGLFGYIGAGLYQSIKWLFVRN